VYAVVRTFGNIVQRTAAELAEYFAGTRTGFDLPIRLTGGTAFQRSVWQGLAGLGFGEVISYGDLGASIGRPGSGRATGGAVGELRLSSERAAWPLRLGRAERWSGPGWVLLGDPVMLAEGVLVTVGVGTHGGQHRGALVGEPVLVADVVLVTVGVGTQGGGHGGAVVGEPVLVADVVLVGGGVGAQVGDPVLVGRAVLAGTGLV